MCSRLWLKCKRVVHTTAAQYPVNNHCSSLITAFYLTTSVSESSSHDGCGKVRDVRSDDVDRSRGAVFITSVAFAGNGTHG